MVGGVCEIPCGRGIHMGTIMSLWTWPRYGLDTGKGLIHTPTASNYLRSPHPCSYRLFSHHPQPGEHINPYLNVLLCLEGKRCVQTRARCLSPPPTITVTSTPTASHRHHQTNGDAMRTHTRRGDMPTREAQAQKSSVECHAYPCLTLTYQGVNKSINSERPG